MDIKLIHWCIT